MKLEEAKRIIDGAIDGYYIDFEEKDDIVLRGGHFPDYHNEPLIKSKEDAIDLAKKFVAANENYKYVHVRSAKIRNGEYITNRVTDNFDDRKCSYWDAEKQCQIPFEEGTKSTKPAPDSKTLSDFTFKYDEIADVLWIRSGIMDLPEKSFEVRELPNMTRIYYDRFTKKIIGARLTGFGGLLNDKFGFHSWSEGN